MLITFLLWKLFEVKFKNKKFCLNFLIRKDFNNGGKF